MAYMIVKGSVLVLGIISMILLVAVAHLGGILEVRWPYIAHFDDGSTIPFLNNLLILIQLATSLSAIAAGTTFGVFTLGMLIPWSNNKGAIWGAIAGAIMSGWISFGTQATIASGDVQAHRLDISIDGCDIPITNTTINTPYPDETGVFPLYRLSFMWINPIGILSVLVVGSIVSYFTGPRDLRTIDPQLISPVIHRFLPRECFENCELKSNVLEPETFALKIDDKFSGDDNNATVTIISSWDTRKEWFYYDYVSV